jgi:hypothetical protein
MPAFFAEIVSIILAAAADIIVTLKPHSVLPFISNAIETTDSIECMH